MKSIVGTVVFEVKGRNISRLITRCQREKIVLHSVFYVNDKTKPAARITLDAKDAINFLRVVGTCSLHVRTVRRKGLIFTLKNALKRPVLLFGAVIGAIMLFLLSHYVWAIEYEGIYRIPRETMAELAQSVGFHVAMPGNKEDINEKAHVLSGVGGDIAKVTAHLSGVRLLISVTETEVLSFSQDDEVQNIYAEKDGVCEQVLVYSGKALVKKGDIIRKGDILITGDISTADKTVYTEAKGKILAKIGYTFYGEAKSLLPAKVRSGESRKVLSLSLFGREFRKSPYAEYEEEISDEVFVFDTLLPIKVRSVTLYELTDGYKAASEAERKDFAARIAHEKMLKGLDESAAILSKQTTYDTDENGNVTAVISVVTMEELGIRE